MWQSVYGWQFWSHSGIFLVFWCRLTNFHFNPWHFAWSHCSTTSHGYFLAYVLLFSSCGLQKMQSTHTVCHWQLIWLTQRMVCAQASCWRFWSLGHISGSVRNVLCPALVFNQSALKVASDPSFHSTRSALWQTVMCDQRWLVHMPLVQSEAQPSQIWPKPGPAWEKSKWAPINFCNVVQGFIVHFTVFLHTFFLSLIVYLTVSFCL